MISSLFIAVVYIKTTLVIYTIQYYNRNDNNNIIQTHYRVHVYTKRVKYCTYIYLRPGKKNKRKPTYYICPARRRIIYIYIRVQSFTDIYIL